MNRINEKLSSRERLNLELFHKYTGWIPISVLCSGFNPPVYMAFEIFLKENHRIDLDSYLKSIVDTIEISHSDGYKLSLNKGADIWGVKRKPVSYGSGSYEEIEYYPLQSMQTIDEIRDYAWPETEQFDYSVYSGLINKAKTQKDKYIVLSNANLFETSWYMRGFEQIFVDLVANPELVHEIIEHVTGFYIEHFKNILQSCKDKIDMVFTADDIGGQEGLLVSLKMWEEFIKPYHIRLNKMIHEFGIKVVYHSDGSIMKAVEGLIDMGIDVLQALQFNAKGMDPGILKSKYGDRLCFEGGVCVQKTLPFGTREQVSEEVKKLISVLGENGGYLLGPSHFIQSGTPPENVYAMFETALTYY